MMGPPYGKLPILFPYHSHVRIPKDMGSWYGSRLPFSGVPLLGVPGKSPLTIGKYYSNLLILVSRQFFKEKIGVRRQSTMGTLDERQ